MKKNEARMGTRLLPQALPAPSIQKLLRGPCLSVNFKGGPNSMDRGGPKSASGPRGGGVQIRCYTGAPD